MSLALDYNSFLLGPSVVTGIANAVFYGMLAVTLVLTYRISHTVAFVNGGLAICGGLMWMFLSFESQNITWAAQPDLPGGLSLFIIFVGGAIIGGAYGTIVTGSKIGNAPRLTITTFSLGLMLLLAGLIASLFQEFSALEIPPSPFGDGAFHLWGGQFSHHQAYTMIFLLSLVVFLAYSLARTRTGIFVRAIADNQEASRLVGVPIRKVGMMVYALSGGIAAMTGALITPDFSPDVITLMFIYLRALTVAVVGGFMSVSLALLGAMVFGMVDSMFRSGLFGDISSGTREVVAVGTLFVMVIVVTRFQKQSKDLLDVQGL